MFTNTIFFSFNKAQKRGILFLSFLIIGIQAFYFFSDFNYSVPITSEEKQWLAKQVTLEALRKQKFVIKDTIYPFNPNFMTDFKAYKLGMSVAEIDRLLVFRKQNKFVNSSKEFQEVTKVSDVLLAKIAPSFKFPNWIKSNTSHVISNNFTATIPKKSFVKKDFNSAALQDFENINGIGKVLSNRICSYRNRLGGFVSMLQVADIWGLSPELVGQLQASFTIASYSSIKKIKINDASLKEIAQFPLFNYEIAKEIVRYRSTNGDIESETDLTKIKGLSSEKAKIIALYLYF